MASVGKSDEAIIKTGRQRHWRRCCSDNWRREQRSIQGVAFAYVRKSLRLRRKAGKIKSDVPSMNSHSEKPDQLSGTSWVALRDYFTLWLERLELFYNRRFEDLDTKTTLALTAADKAVNKAETATEKRFEGVNEFRQTLADQASRLMPREEALSKFGNLEKDIAALDKEIQALREQRSGVTGRDLQRDQARQDVTTKQGWLVPMLVIGSIAAINLIVNLVWIMKK